MASEPSSTPQHGYLVLADISGYTAYLAGVELEHAHDILRELLELIVNRFQPLLALAHLDGDAVFAIAPAERLPHGETLLELIEVTYAAFRDRLDSIRRRTTCTCQACRSVSDLDLKFLVHYGQYLAESIAQQPEILGLDVNLVRDRLLKDQASGGGWRGYALFTAPCLAHLGLQPAELHVRELAGTYAHIGEVKTYLLDLQASYQARLDARRVRVDPAKADAHLTHDFTAPPPVVWAWLNDPDKRTRWMAGRTWSAALRIGGRLGVGARNHCNHRQGSLSEVIVDWRPFDYYTVEASASPMNIVTSQTYQLEPLAGTGTRLSTSVRVQTPRWLAGIIGPMLLHVILKRDLDRMARLMELEREK
jgi:uncharacterized protein YndB with AHSA1/START domain